jgi:hypothetical protein
MWRRLILALIVFGVILFGLWRPLSEDATILSPNTTPVVRSLQTINHGIESTGDCAGAPPTRLEIGSQAYVALPNEGSGVRRNLRVRDEPGGEQIAVLQPGTDFMVIGEAVCADDELRWWLIQTLDGTITGWSVEGFAPEDYMISPKKDEM